MAKGGIMLSFRPRNEMIEDYETIENWCKKNRITITAILNAFLPAIAYAVTNDTVEDDDGSMYVQADFGHVLLFKNKSGRGRQRKEYLKNVYLDLEIERAWRLRNRSRPQRYIKKLLDEKAKKRSSAT